MTKAPTRIQKRNRAAILSAGLDVFSQYGFRGTTLDQIAEAAGLSKPNLLYYFPSKEAIHTALLERLLENWLDPLKALDASGDPVQEISAYVRRKLALSKDFPRESRLFANEILQGAPWIEGILRNDLKHLVDEKAVIIQGWADAGKIAPVDPYHLIFSIWALTQHYADFDVQVRAVLGDRAPYDGAAVFLDQLYDKLLTPTQADGKAE
ncbi:MULTISPECIES: TetR family transcriptional regulator C-terminal domain-containing protein [unclassified Yoonia]|uniref:TetR family transcriptional regulator C-terminal domain-containing protein n=1 Tax=unclassified Yoonia TaxID=2629118 RepID=UPI002AFE061B|nr:MULTISPECIES: TetR family transcriptional regulator C-terminal domain-containing protein [unclassified Yoonia]